VLTDKGVRDRVLRLVLKLLRMTEQCDPMLKNFKESLEKRCLCFVALTVQLQLIKCCRGVKLTCETLLVWAWLFSLICWFYFTLLFYVIILTVLLFCCTLFYFWCAVNIHPFLLDIIFVAGNSLFKICSLVFLMLLLFHLLKENHSEWFYYCSSNMWCMPVSKV
jgi:hypothetical protein